MNKYFNTLTRIPLFEGISETDLSALLTCLSAQVKQYSKNEIILLAESSPASLGIVLCGSIQIIKEDVFGNRTILTQFGEGNLFGEAYSFAQTEKIPVTVISVTESDILFIDYHRIFSACSSACDFHTLLIQNMLSILAQKNILLSEKIEIMSKRTTKEKLLAFLYGQSQHHGSLSFQIPFDRQQLADYLCVDRSALSNELSKLQDEGILSFQRSYFQLHRNYR